MVETRVGCDCDDWKTFSGKIDGVIVFAFIHGKKIDMKRFTYCPWCGKRLVEEEPG